MHIITPLIIQNQGIKKPVFRPRLIRFPITIPRRIPKKPPNTHITTLSIKNWFLMVCCVAPMALRTPISRVRSVTLTSIMFINPMAAPSNVMRPMMVAPAVTFCRFSIRSVARLSDLTMSKSSLAPIGSFLIFLNMPVAS